jgi:hypothetical protein
MGLDLREAPPAPCSFFFANFKEKKTPQNFMALLAHTATSPLNFQTPVL